MKIFPKRFGHLVRYFIFLGFLVFLSYLMRWEEILTLVMIGPVLFLAHLLKTAASGFVPLPSSPALNDFLFVFPLTMGYFILLGFQLKSLYNERGVVRIVMVLTLSAFVIFIHFLAWKNLSDYLSA